MRIANSRRTASRDSPAGRSTRSAWADLRRSRSFSRPRSIDGETSAGAARRAPRHHRARARTCPADRIYYLAAAAVAVRADRPAARSRPASSAGTNGARSTRLVVEKPIGTDLAERLRHQRRDRRGLRRAADLPDRSLPRQGNRPEHPGDALREQHLRAAVQPAVHRSRADHGGGGRRRRHARRLLRAGRRAARHGAEPHAAAAVAGGDGAAALARRRRHPRREARSAAVAAAARGADVDATSSARSTRGDVRRQAGPGYREESGVSRARAPKPSWRCRSSSTTGAGPAFRSSCGPASGCRSARARSRSTSKRCRRFSSTPIRRSGWSRMSSTIRIQPDEGFSLGISSQGSGPAASTSSR